MRLLHFSGLAHVDALLQSGLILTTESNIGAKDTPESRAAGYHPIGHNVGPDVVWLTEADDPAVSGITGGPDDKGKVRITVEVPDQDLHHWPTWARAQGIDERWYEGLGAPPNTPDLWWVVERNVPWDEWVQMDELIPLQRDERRERDKLLRKGRDPGPLPARTIWTHADGLTPTVTEAEIRSVTLTLLHDYGDGTCLVRDANGVEKRIRI